MNRPMKLAMAGLMLAGSLPLVAACSDNADTTDTATATANSQPSTTMAAALQDMPGAKTFDAALKESQLSTVFDGPGAYTVLAPDDAAFSQLGDAGKGLLEKQQRPLLVSILRDHILPGQVTMENITSAIDKKGGPVKMNTLGGTELTFAKQGDTITVSNGAGTTAQLTGKQTLASNGVILPINMVLMPPKSS